MLSRISAFVLIFISLSYSANAAGISEIYVKPGNKSWGSEVLETLIGAKGFGKSYALIIGIGDYNHYRKLAAPAHDAERVRDFLTKEAQFDYVVTLTEEKASRAQIENLMEREFPTMLKDNDRFLFYFSGHGATRKLSRTRRGYLVLKSSPQDAWDQMIDMQKMYQWTENVGHARHVLFLLDACFGGLAAPQIKDGATKERTIARLMQPASHIVSAGVEDEYSYSVDNASLFTSGFLAAARGDLGPAKDGVISLSEIVVKINQFIDAQRARTGRAYKMTPHQFDARDENNAGEFFFLPVSSSEKAADTPEPSSPPENKGNIIDAPAVDVRKHPPSEVPKKPTPPNPPEATIGKCKITAFQQCLLREAGGRLDPMLCRVTWVNQMMAVRDECRRKFPN
jgi:hypothetical protein